MEYQNTRALREGNVVSPNELALAQANLNRVNAQRQLAQAHPTCASRGSRLPSTVSSGA